MWIMGKRFNNRAVSQVIAALLLIAIAVAAAVLVYVFSIGLLGSLQGGGGQQVKQQLILEAYNWGTLASPILTMRNVGTAGITVADVFVNGVLATATVGGAGTGCNTPTGNVPVLTSCTISITGYGTGTFPGAGNSPTSGVAYPIKIVTSDGGVFSYSAIAGQSS
jgi:flagellin-like protein